MQPSYPNTPPTAFWRVIHFPLVTLAIGLTMVVLPNIAVAASARFIHPRDQLGVGGAQLAGALLSIALTILFYGLFNRFVERRPNVEYQPAGAVRELGAGLIGGVLLFSLVMGAMAMLGGYRITGWNGATGLATALAIGFGPGFIEETIARGLIFRLVEQWLGSWAALFVSALLFGAAHLGNAHATLLAGAAIAIEAGLMLAALHMLTRRLWAAIGLHAAWNFTQGGIYSVPVSGFPSNGLVTQSTQGPTWLTGGAFGAEASLPAVAICTIFGLAVLIAAARRGRLVPFLPRRRPNGPAVTPL